MRPRWGGFHKQRLRTCDLADDAHARFLARLAKVRRLPRDVNRVRAAQEVCRRHGLRRELGWLEEIEGEPWSKVRAAERPSGRRPRQGEPI